VHFSVVRFEPVLKNVTYLVFNDILCNVFLYFVCLAVFYNPVQETNRDLSVAVLKQFVELRREEEAQKQAKRMGKRKYEQIEKEIKDSNDTTTASAHDIVQASATLKPLSILEALSATGTSICHRSSSNSSGVCFTIYALFVSIAFFG
jgi:hypothetical protein